MRPTSGAGSRRNRIVLCRMIAPVRYRAAAGSARGDPGAGSGSMGGLRGEGTVEVVEVGTAHVDGVRCESGCEQGGQVGRRVRAADPQLAVRGPGPAGDP